ncbi:hypothetical protein Tco_0955012 [Tanacetum coccineum]|uniref:Xylulose kinase-1 n=1 Tax=Tanacetum coccineum TaxID=301880 RepID=A0ABQ5E610_9ASTR
MAVLDSCPKHNMVAYLEKSEGNAEFHEIIDFLTRSSIHHALTVSPVVSTIFVEQFWTSAKSKIINNVRNITAKVAGKPVSISEASIRSDLLFDDANGIDSLPNQAIFDAIQLMGGFIQKPFCLCIYGQLSYHISSDSSDESGDHRPSRVILFGDIPTVIPSTLVVAPETSTIAPVISSAAPVVETTLVASPTGLCGLGFRRRSAILIRPEEAIPFGRPYRTHLNGPRKLLTARKRVRLLPARRLASRHASPRSPDHHSSSDFSPVHSLGLD